MLSIKNQSYCIFAYLVCCIIVPPPPPPHAIDGTYEVPLPLSNFYMGVMSIFTSLSCVQELLFDNSALFCEMEVYNAEKSYVCTDVAVQISNWSSDDNKHVEFSSVHMSFTPLWLVLVVQYLISQSLMMDSNFARRHDKSLVVHLLKPAIK